MANTIVAAHVPLSEDELSDEQMQQMLARAAARKQESISLRLAGEETKDKQFSFPKLSTGEIAKPYVSTTGQVAQVDSSRLLQEKDRVLADKIRKIEDPVALKQKKAEVRDYFFLASFDPFHFQSIAYEENNPNFLT